MADTPHPEAQDIIKRTEAHLYPPSHALTPESARERLESLFSGQHAESVQTVETFEIPGPDSGIPVRIYEPDADPPHPVLLFYHGGGMVAGSLDTHHNVCAALTNRADCLTISVDYRLAPEHPFPAGLEDCYAALEWAAEFAPDLDADPDRIAVAGDSAGGNLAAATALLARDQDGPAIDYQALIYPAVASPAVHDFDSYEENGEGYLLEFDSTEWYFDQYIPGPVHMRNPYIAPLLASDHSNLPPATIVTAGFDLHRDEGIAYAEALDSAGVPVEHRHYEGMIHSFVSLYGLLSQGEDAIDAIGQDLRDAFED